MQQITFAREIYFSILQDIGEAWRARNWQALREIMHDLRDWFAWFRRHD